MCKILDPKFRLWNCLITSLIFKKAYVNVCGERWGWQFEKELSQFFLNQIFHFVSSVMLGFQMFYSTLMKITEHNGPVWSAGGVAGDLEPTFSSALITLLYSETLWNYVTVSLC